eukprot:scaffold74270_cov67-Phaeocystis_antarctica.AAC.1
MRRSSLAPALLLLVQVDASCLTWASCSTSGYGASQSITSGGITYNYCCSGKMCSAANDCSGSTAAASPPPPLATASQASAYFTVVGPCTLDGACVRSPNYPSNYGVSQSCTITPTSLAVGQLLSAKAGFTTESGYDKLIVNGATYDGTTGPSGELLGSSAFTWSSDVSGNRAGWEVCAAPLLNLVLTNDGDTCAAGTEITSQAACSAAITAANAAIGKPGSGTVSSVDYSFRPKGCSSRCYSTNSAGYFCGYFNTHANGDGTGTDAGNDRYVHCLSPCACDTISIALSGGAYNAQYSNAGQYTKISATQGGRPVYQQTGGSQYLYFWASLSDWLVGPSYTQGNIARLVSTSNGIINGNTNCPEAAGDSWQYYGGSSWQSGGVQVTCSALSPPSPPLPPPPPPPAPAPPPPPSPSPPPPPTPCACDTISIALSGGAYTALYSKAGEYTKISATQGGRAVYQQTGGTTYLYFWAAYGAWRVGIDYTSSAAWLSVTPSGNTNCPEAAGDSVMWQYWDGATWTSSGVEVTCSVLSPPSPPLPPPPPSPAPICYGDSPGTATSSCSYENKNGVVTCSPTGCRATCPGYVAAGTQE